MTYSKVIYEFAAYLFIVYGPGVQIARLPFELMSENPAIPLMKRITYFKSDLEWVHTQQGIRRWFAEIDRRKAEVDEYLKQSAELTKRGEQTLRETAELKKLIGPDPVEMPKRP